MRRAEPATVPLWVMFLAVLAGGALGIWLMDRATHPMRMCRVELDGGIWETAVPCP